MAFCKLCNHEAKDIRLLSYHIRTSHKDISTKAYYDSFLKEETEGNCVECNSETTYQGITTGYSVCCSSRKCSGKYHRRTMKEDHEKQEAFSKKVQDNMKRKWKEREESGEKQAIVQNISNGVQKWFSAATPEERWAKSSRYATMEPDAIAALNEKNRNQCLQNHLLGLSGPKSTMKGKFKPKNIHKYKGDPTQIVYRSGWELSLMSSFDTDKKVKLWSSEEVIIPYTSPVDNRYHRYFVDFFVEYCDGSKRLIEVKPHAQTQPPKRREKQTDRTYIKEVKTFCVNQAKWDSARRYCDARGWEFQVLTEKEMKGVFL